MKRECITDEFPGKKYCLIFKKKKLISMAIMETTAWIWQNDVWVDKLT